MANFTCFAPNLSRDSLTPGAWDVSYYGDAATRNVNTIASFLLLFFLLGVPWNIMVIVCAVKQHLYVQPGVILLLNLAVVDLLLCLIVLPFNIISGVAAEYVFGNSDAVRCMVCQTGIVVTLLTFMSFHTVTLMSIDRLLYLLKPLSYSTIVTPKRILFVLLLTWIVCVILAMPPIFEFGEMEFGVVIGTCALLLTGSGQTPTNTSYIALLVVEIVVVLLVLIVANVAILFVVRRHLKQVNDLRKLDKESEASADSNSLPPFSIKSQKIQSYLLRMLAAVLISNFFLLLPIIFLAIAGAAARFNQVPSPYISFSYVTFMSQTLVHPVLESIFVKEIASQFLNFWKSRFVCTCSCKTSPRPKSDTESPV